METRLSHIIDMYGEIDSDIKTKQKEHKELSAQIKKEMREHDMKNSESSKYRVSYSSYDKETVQEDRMLEILKNHEIKGVVKLVETIDYDELENKLYNNEISPEVLEELAACKTTTTIEKLTISKIKEIAKNGK